MQKIRGIVHETSQMHTMMLGQVLQECMGPNLVTLVRRVGYAVREIKDFHGKISL
jgi:hypothetical protein